MSIVTVSGSAPYDISIGPGTRHELRERLGTQVAKALLIHAPIMASEAARIREALAGDVDVLLAEVPEA